MSNIDKQTTTTQDNTNNKKFTSKPFLFGLTWKLYMLNGGNNLKQPRTIKMSSRTCTLLFNVNSSLVIDYFICILINTLTFTLQLFANKSFAASSKPALAATWIAVLRSLFAAFTSHPVCNKIRTILTLSLQLSWNWGFLWFLNIILKIFL